MPVTHIWTTNYDRLIERAFTEIDRPLDTISGAKDLSLKPTAGAVRLYKMHGSIDRLDDIVISTDDYELFRTKRGAFLPLLQAHLTSMSMLFVGLSFTDPNTLPIRGEWQTDGPHLPLEFARQSSGDRMTLVIVENARPVQVLWIRLEAASLPEAIGALAEREGSSRRDIGRWPLQQGETYPHAEMIGQWATEKRIEAVVWTALPCGMRMSRGVIPSLADLKAHFDSLDDVPRAEVAKYVVNAPAQIQTPFRPLLERCLSRNRRSDPYGQSPLCD
jgi:hypothetical protein